MGDDLPAGAFTSGPNGSGDVDSTSTVSATSNGSGQTSMVDPTTTDDPTVDSGDIPLDLTHDEDILPIWTANCLGSSCHDAAATVSALDLESPDPYPRLCDGFHGFSGMPYIDCTGFDPQNSYVFRKLEGSHLDGDISGASGLPMPPTGSLSDADLAAIEGWITGGAVQ